MKWKAEYAALRYFRRYGAEIRKASKLVIFNSHPGCRRQAYDKNREILARLGYGFSDSLFMNQ